MAVLLAVLAALLAVPVPAAATLSDRLPRSVATPKLRRRGGLRWLAGSAATAACLVLALVAGGARALVLTLAGCVLLGTTLRLLRLRTQRLRTVAARRAVAEAAQVLAANLRVGMVPAVALRVAAASCPVLEEAAATLAIGGEVPAVLRRQARTDGQLGLRDVARAWEVAAGSGASLTGTLEQVAAGLSADESLQAVVGSELAAPRATGKLMAALPALGIGMGYLIGGDPLRWLTAGVAGWACLLLGVTLACCGVLWIEALARRVAGQR